MSSLLNPRSGSHYAFLTDPDWYPDDDLDGGLITPLIQIPSDTTDATLSYWVNISTDETIFAEFDTLVLYLVEQGNILTEIDRLTNEDDTGGSYSPRQISISSSFFGKSVNLFFNGKTDFSNPTVFRIDDASFIATVPDQPPSDRPDVTTLQADQITKTTARLNMTVNPNGADTDVWFDFEANDSTPNDDTEHLSIGAGYEDEDVSISVSDLDCNTLYYVEANASNDHGSDDGVTRSFTTDSCDDPPRADTDPAINITKTSATLRADILPNGLATVAWFTWGETSSMNNTTPEGSVGSGTSWVDFDYALTNLACGTQYYFKAYAENDAGTDSDVTLTFQTSDCDLFSLTVQKEGAGDGTVTSNPAGINCGSDCIETYEASTTVTLTPDAEEGSAFDHWEGDCVNGVVTMNADKLCTAVFDLSSPSPPLRTCDIIQVTDTLDGDSVFPSISADGSVVVFKSEADLTGGNADGNGEIFSVDVGTQVITQITNTTGLNSSPSINSDGTRVVFPSHANITGGNLDGSFEIFLYNAVSGVFQQLTSSYKHSDWVSVNADGTLIAFRSSANHTGENKDGSYEMFLLDLFTDEFTQITDLPEVDSFTYSPLISGNGTAVVFYTTSDLTGENPDGNREIFYYHTLTDTLTQITDDEAEDSYPSALDEGGKTVLFYSWADLIGENPGIGSEVFLFDSETSAISQLTDSVNLSSYGEDIGNDGSKILFSSRDDYSGDNPEGHNELFYLDLHTNFITQLTDNKSSTGDVQRASLSGDGSVFAIQANSNLTGENADGNHEIFVGLFCDPMFSDGFESGNTSAWSNTVGADISVCGNGSVEIGEVCDDGADNGPCPIATCSADCTLNSCNPGDYFDTFAVTFEESRPEGDLYLYWGIFILQDTSDVTVTDSLGRVVSSEGGFFVGSTEHEMESISPDRVKFHGITSTGATIGAGLVLFQSGTSPTVDDFTATWTSHENP